MRQSLGKRSAVRAIDADIVVRFLTADDPRQTQAARRVIEAGDVFIGTTVALETEQVLRAGYGFTSRQKTGLRGLGGAQVLQSRSPRISHGR